MFYVHVENLVDAILLALTRPEAAGRVYNIADGRVKRGDFAEWVPQIGGRSPGAVRAAAGVARRKRPIRIGHLLTPRAGIGARMSSGNSGGN